MLTVIAFLAAVAGLSLAAHFWRERQSLNALITEGSKRFEELRHYCQSMENAQGKTSKQNTELKAKEEYFRTTIINLNTEMDRKTIGFEVFKADLERKIRDVENQRDLMMYETEKAKATIRNLEEKNEQLASDLLASRELLSKRPEPVIERSSTKDLDLMTALKSKVEALEKEVRIYRSRPEVHPRSFDTLKRRVNQYELLYQGVKGQKTMMEERSRNWEFALDRLAHWILTKSTLAKANDPVVQEGIGPKVGEALERIGETMVAAESEASLEQASQDHGSYDAH